jgi:hypothetical protein
MVDSIVESWTRHQNGLLGTRFQLHGPNRNGTLLCRSLIPCLGNFLMKLQMRSEEPMPNQAKETNNQNTKHLSRFSRVLSSFHSHRGNILPYNLSSTVLTKINHPPPDLSITVIKKMGRLANLLGEQIVAAWHASKLCSYRANKSLTCNTCTQRCTNEARCGTWNKPIE